MRTIILIALAISSAVATVCAHERETAMPHDSASLVTPEGLRWLASPSTCLGSTPPEWCGPSPAVVPFAGEQRGYDLHDLHDLCGHVFYERLARYGRSPTGQAHERALVLEGIPVVLEEEIRVVWAGDPAASLCALLDTGTEARYLLVEDLAGSSPSHSRRDLDLSRAGVSDGDPHDGTFPAIGRNQ